MKKLFLFLSVFAFSYSLKAQYTHLGWDYVYTPVGSQVKGDKYRDDRTPVQITARDNMCTSDPFITVYQLLASSTWTYNCHGYAWLIKGYKPNTQSLQRFLEPQIPGSAINEDVRLFITDGSYIQVPRPVPGAKAWWANGSHSAVVTADTLKYISKDTDGPLVEHNWNSIYFGPIGGMTYYVDPSTINIEGPSFVCGTTPYKVRIVQGNGETVTWSWVSSNGLSISGATNQPTVNVISSGSGQTGTLKVEIKKGNTLLVSKTKTITSGCPAISPSSSSNFEICYSGQTFQLINSPGTITWTLDANAAFSFSASSDVYTSTAAQPSVFRRPYKLKSNTATLCARINGSAGTIVASQAITACQPNIPASVVGWDGTQFTLNNAPPSQTITWTVTSPFYFLYFGLPAQTMPAPTYVAVYRTTSTATGTITTSYPVLDGTVIYSKTIMPCVTTISGPNTICVGNQATYTVTNAPSTITWGKSANLSGSSSTASLTVTAASSGSAYVSITLGGVEIARKDITIYATPPSRSVNGDGYFGYASTGYYELSSAYSGESYSWDISPTSAVSLTYSWYNNYPKDCVQVQPANPFPSQYYGITYTLTATITGSSGCTTEAWKNFSIMSWPSPAPPPYPNPASSTLNIDLEAGSAGSTKAYDIRLYDEQGNLQRQSTTKGGTVQIDVSNLPNGTYFLHIYDGVSKTPQMQQIVVEH
jgi:hypothetical protein